MIDALRQCEITSLAALQRTLDDVDSIQVNQAMQHVIAAGQVRRLEDDLLAALGTTYIARTAHDDDRKALLTRRLTKLR